MYSGRGNCSAVAQALNSYNTVNVILNHVDYRLSLNDVAKVYGKEGVHKRLHLIHNCSSHIHFSEGKRHGIMCAG